MDELCAALETLGHSVVLVGPARTARIEFGADAGLVSWLKRVCPQALYELLELSYNFIAIPRLWWAVRKHRPDAIYERYNLFFLAGALIRRVCRVPFLLEVNSPLFEERGREDGIALRRIAAWAERAVWRSGDAVLPVTDVLAGYIRRAGVPSEKITVIPNGIDPAKFAEKRDGAEIKRQLGLEGRLVLGFTGFVRSWNNLDRVLEILAELPTELNVTLLVVGDGPALPQLRDRAEQLRVSDCLHITGIVPRDRIAAYVAAFDIALQPGVTAYASPLKLLEYMAAGLAIIAPDQANIRELLIHRQNALLIDPTKPHALRAAILELCQNANLRTELGAAARETIAVRRLTWVENANTVIELVERLWRDDSGRWRGRAPVVSQS